MRRTVPVLAAAFLAVLACATPARAASDAKGTTYMQFTGTWQAGYSGQVSWTPGSTATAVVDVATGGGTISIFGRSNTNAGVAGVQIDGGPTTNVNTAATKDADRVWYTSPVLPAGRHTIKVSVAGAYQSPGTGWTITVREVRTSNGTIVPPSQWNPTPPPPPPAPAPSPLPGPRSGLPWVSGAYLDHNAANIGPFETGRGRALDAVQVFPARDSQAAMLNTWWLAGVKPVTDAGGWAVVTVPLWAADQTVATDTTALFTQLGQQINANLPADRTLVRLGWEMNLPGQYWNVTAANRAQWVADFQRAAALLRQYAPGVKIAFNPNEGPSQTSLADIGALAADLSASFDFVGPDFYNWYPQMDTLSVWTSRYNESYGLAYWENWATAHGKGYTVPEWGVTTAVNNSTGELYVQQMIGRFSALAAAGTPVIESYFNEPASFIMSSLWNPQQAPVAAQTYHDALAAP